MSDEKQETHEEKVLRLGQRAVNKLTFLVNAYMEGANEDSRFNTVALTAPRKDGTFNIAIGLEVPPDVRFVIPTGLSAPTEKEAEDICEGLLRAFQRIHAGSDEIQMQGKVESADDAKAKSFRNDPTGSGTVH